MRSWALAAALLIGSCCGPVRLVAVDAGDSDAGADGGCDPDAGLGPYCLGPCTPYDHRNCYDGPAGTEDVGICHAGVQMCGEDWQWGPCQGEQTPQPEKCDCRDDDCNGVVDDIPDTQFCYDGPDGTAGVGVCHPGVWACGTGAECGTQFCKGEQTPEPAQCDGVDHTCVGHPETTQDPVDVLFLVDDTDGTCEDGMVQDPQILQDVQGAIQEFVALYPQPNFSYALGYLPGCQDWTQALGVPPRGAQETIFQGWSDAASFSPAVVGTQCLIDATTYDQCQQSEPYYPYDVLSSEAAGRPLPWQPGARRFIVMFSGDEGESISSTAAATGLVLADAGVTPVVFVANWQYETDYYPVVQHGGAVFVLMGQQQILAELQQSLTFPCMPDGG